MKIIRFGFLKLHNFKSHRDLEVSFGDVTKVSGDNAVGKSSILEAIPFTFYGVDVLGSKSDPTPTNYEYDYVRSELQLFLDDKEIRLARGIEKGEAVYWINDVPSKATEFNDLIKKLFDNKDVFLSLFNPTYFFTLHPLNEQRPLFLRYVPAPANKEVFAKMDALQADKLAALVKKHSLAELDKIHRENKTKQDKAYIAAQSRTKTLQEQLQRLAVPQFDLETAKAESARIDAQVKAEEGILDTAHENNRKIDTLSAALNSLSDQIEQGKADHKRLFEREIKSNCETCGQKLTGDAEEKAKQSKAEAVSAIAERVNPLIHKRKAIREELAALEYIDVSEQLQKVREIDDQGEPYREAVRLHDQRSDLEQQIVAATKAEADTLTSRNDSTFILDAIKAFHAKSAELQADKVKSLFTTLSLRLFKVNKTDSEIKADFEIEMDGKPYRKLSLSEGIRAGLELREVLSKQSEIIAPVFVDNAESITRYKRPSGQLIESRVVADQPLKIETEDAE